MKLPHLFVDFSQPLRSWDGFGINYVEACQTRDYDAYPQEYGGFRYLTAEQRREIIALSFGDDGLRPGLVKMFLDCWHQAEPTAGYDLNDPVIDPRQYDHDKTTRRMQEFVTEGHRLTTARGDELDLLVTLYGPPAWMTRQKYVRGRDLDPAYTTEIIKYMAAWAKYLRDEKGLPVHHISVHNEGEDWPRWPLDGEGAGEPNHDYNLYWSPDMVADFMKRFPAVLRANGLHDVTVTPGECTGWYRFHMWGYAEAVANDPEAVASLGLITSHGFAGRPHQHEFFNDWRSAGIDLLRAKRPELHAWVTSTSWSQMDVFFIEEMRQSIYSAGVNGIIPWAAIQLQNHWTGGDPNPGTAFKVWDDGRYEVTKGYYFYKQVCRAGQPGMQVCQVRANDRRIGLIGFAGGDTKHPDTFIALNLGDTPRTVSIETRGTMRTGFEAFHTSESANYEPFGLFPVQDGAIHVTLAPRSVTTFYGR
jgi:hypothetical protein